MINLSVVVWLPDESSTLISMCLLCIYSMPASIPCDARCRSETLISHAIVTVYVKLYFIFNVENIIQFNGSIMALAKFRCEQVNSMVNTLNVNQRKSLAQTFSVGCVTTTFTKFQGNFQETRETISCRKYRWTLDNAIGAFSFPLSLGN